MSCERVRHDIVECTADRREFPPETAAHLNVCASCAAWARDVGRINDLVDRMTARSMLLSDIAGSVARRAEGDAPAGRIGTPRFAFGAAFCALVAGAAAFLVNTYSVSVQVVPRNARIPAQYADASGETPPVHDTAGETIRSAAGRGGWPHRRSIRTSGAAGPAAERTTVAAVRQRSESQPERQGVPSSDLLLKSPDPTPGTSTVAQEAAPPTVARGAAFDTPPERGSDPVVPGDKVLVFGPPPAKTYTKRDSAASDAAAARASGGFAAMGAARSAAQLPGAPSPGEVRISGGSDVYINPGRGEKADISVCPAENGAVSVRVFSTGGRLLWEAHRDASAGSVLNIEWSGTNSGGQTLASGVYIVVVRGAGINARRKICIVR